MDVRLDGPDDQFLDAAQAARFLGCGEDVFEQVAAQEADWLRAVNHGTEKQVRRRWARADVAVLAYLIARRGSLRRPRPPGESQPEMGGNPGGTGG